MPTPSSETSGHLSRAIAPVASSRRRATRRSSPVVARPAADRVEALGLCRARWRRRSRRALLGRRPRRRSWRPARRRRHRRAQELRLAPHGAVGRVAERRRRVAAGSAGGGWRTMPWKASSARRRSTCPALSRPVRSPKFSPRGLRYRRARQARDRTGAPGTMPAQDPDPLERV